MHSPGAVRDPRRGGESTIDPRPQVDDREYQQTTFRRCRAERAFARATLCSPLVRVSSLAFVDCNDPAVVSMTADAMVYIDDGLPAELRNCDLMVDIRPFIASNWTIPKG